MLDSMKDKTSPQMTVRPDKPVRPDKVVIELKKTPLIVLTYLAGDKVLTSTFDCTGRDNGGKGFVEFFGVHVHDQVAVGYTYFYVAKTDYRSTLTMNSKFIISISSNLFDVIDLEDYHEAYRIHRSGTPVKFKVT
jgi:hypothetical protein